MTFSINPDEWEAVWARIPWRLKEAKTREPVTPWFNGKTAPVRVGWYERMYTDGLFRHYWDGQVWRARPEDPPHWRQVGDYPLWRGLRRSA